MDRKLAFGTTVFAILTVVFGAAVQILIELAGVGSALGIQIGTSLIATPLALLAGRRLGRLTHMSVLFASALVAVLTLWAIVLILNSIGEPTGSYGGWGNLLHPMTWRNTVFGTMAAVVVPQAWLLVFNRMAANNSSKPTPLRGAA